jgi:NitT/TauT family transport system substrate-binding protein
MVNLRKPAVAFAVVLGASAAISVSAAGAKTSLFKMKVGVSPTISSVDVLYAAKAGYFTREGLDVTTTVNTTSGAATFPLLLNGQLAMTVTDPVSPILAIDKGVPLQMDAEGNIIDSKPSKDYAGLEVKSNSGLTSAAQLAGKSVAVPSLDSILQLLAQATIDAAGGNSSKVNFVEVPPLSMVDAVSQGQVTAFSNVEPLLTEGKASGEKILAHPPAAMGGLPEDVLVSSTKFAKAHPNVITEFRAAITLANAKLAADPSLIVKTAAAEGEVSPSVVHKIILPVFQGGTLTSTMLDRLMTYMVKYHYISKPIAITKILGDS